MSLLNTWMKWREYLVCPFCKGSLSFLEENIECNRCHHMFSVKDGIPYFVEFDELDDFELGESEFHSNVSEKADNAHGQATLRAKYLHDGFIGPIEKLPLESVILDVACGTGIDLVRLAVQGYYVIGLDISPGMIRTTIKKGDELGISDRIFLCVATGRQMPFRDECFQAAYICAALHHMQNPKAVLNEMARVTQISGIVSIGSEPNAWIYKFRSLKHSRLGRRFLQIFRNDYTIGDQSPGDKETPGWTKKNLIAMLSNTGLETNEIKPIWYINGIVSLLGLHSLPHWIENIFISTDKILCNVPFIRNYSVKWNVISNRVL